MGSLVIKALDRITGAKPVELNENISLAKQKERDESTFRARLKVFHKIAPFVIMATIIAPLFYSEWASKKLYHDENAMNVLSSPSKVLDGRSHTQYEKKL